LEGRDENEIIRLDYGGSVMFPFVTNEAVKRSQHRPQQKNGRGKAVRPTPSRAVDDALGKAGVAPADKAGINIYGYVEGGYFHDFSASSLTVVQPSSGLTVSERRYPDRSV
jgi:hypothetical protein